jgi:mitofilin
MAFYARSEEARQSHSVHKLALGALALDDTLSKGLPVQKEIDTLQTYLEGTHKDSILGLVLSSLPEEARSNGTDTVLQLNQKFDTLKGTLRHFSLIPPGGGGILAHSLAHVASSLKFKEVDQANGGIESVIKKVDNYLAEGKLAEAAATLEEGVKGSKAEEIVSDWVRRARNRAITEQALTLLQSYATCVSLT